MTTINFQTFFDELNGVQDEGFGLGKFFAKLTGVNGSEKDTTGCR